MAGNIVMWIVSFGCALTFFGIGVYAQKLEKPMWFWSGIEVDASKITDVKQYNRENGIMWKLYSLWYFASGLAQIWSSVASLVLLIAGCTVGIIFLVYHYNKIYKKYSVK